MQNIDLICLGKLNAKYYAEGVAEYTKRLSAFANFKIIELPEEKIEEKNASPVEGKQSSSEELAALLAQKAGSGAGDLAFVIGSSHGLSEEVKRAAGARISLGRITLPHQLARLVLTEQLYRACTINAGMKYHK